MQEYTAILDAALVENTKLKFDLYLKIHDKGVTKYVLFTRGGEKYSSEKKDELIKKKAKCLFIATKDINKYLNYQEKSLKQFITNKSKTSLEKSEVVYQVANNLTEDLMNDPESDQHIERAATWVTNTVTHVFQDEDTYSSLFKVASRDYDLYTHSINVSVIGLLFGKHLSLSQHDLNYLGKGLLLHDIGKVEIPSEILDKPDELTKDEFEIFKRHPEIGLRLLENKEDIEETTLKIISQHHENYNGTGYPKGIAGSDIHLFGSISRIIDAYDGATTRRNNKVAKGPFAALAEMKEKMIKCFDEELFKEFILFLGPKDLRKKQRPDDILHTKSAQI